MGVVAYTYKDRDVRSYYDAADVMEIMGVGRSKAYTMIRIMREELVNSGELTACYPLGKVPKRYFDKMCCIGKE